MPEDALLYFGLAPLDARRDIAVLGVIHRTVLGLGPKHFQKFFIPANASSHPGGRLATHGHDKQITSYRRGHFLDIMAHSQIGAIDI